MTGRNIKKGSFKKGEDAVSPVIGVILMVAITVILAAVIGAFVFGMGPTESAPTINFRVTGSNSTTVNLEVLGGDDVALTSLTFKSNGVASTAATGTTTTSAGSKIALTFASATGDVAVIDTATNTVIFQAPI